MSFSQIPCSEGSKDVPVDFIVKLGGSAITDKNVFAQSKTNEIQHISKILKMCRDKQKIFIIVHGAGWGALMLQYFKLQTWHFNATV